MAKRPTVRTKEEMVEAAVVAAEKTEQETLVLANGTIVRPRQLPETLLKRLYDSNPEPPVPVISKEIAGKMIETENPGDPNYKEALEEHKANLGEAIFSLTMLRGVRVEKLGPGCLPYEDEDKDEGEDEEWAMELELYGLEVPEKGPVRKMMWCESQIITTTGDLVAVQEASMALSGATEAGIALATERFQRSASGDAGSEDSDEELGSEVESGVRGEASS